MSLRDKYKGDFYAALGDPGITDEQFKAVIKEAPHIGARFDEKTGRRIIDKSLEKPYEEYLPKNRPRNKAEAEVYETTKRGDSFGIGKGDDDLKNPINIMKLAAALGKKKDIEGVESIDYESGIQTLSKLHPELIERLGIKVRQPDIMGQARAAIAANPKNREEVIRRLKAQGLSAEGL